jgi:hypothetical protein
VECTDPLAREDPRSHPASIRGPEPTRARGRAQAIGASIVALTPVPALEDPVHHPAHSPETEPTLDLTPPPASPRRRAAQRTRALTLAGLAALAVAAISVLTADPPPPLPNQLAVAIAVAFAVLITGALLARLRRLWERGTRRALLRAGDLLGTISTSLWPWSSSNDQKNTQEPLRSGERVALLAGLALTLLDVALTVLLLRDVFPEPPYRLPLLDQLSPALAEWSFYLAVAAFKTLLELWLGVVDRLRARAGEGAKSLRWFVLGAASAFDAALAVARGLLLAEQGLTGATVLVSNIVFVGFGLAVPWVVAHTGGLLVDAADPFLARFGLLRALSALPRLLLLAALWGLAIALGAPIVLALLAVGALIVVWSALDEMIALVLGHDDPDADLAAAEPTFQRAAPPVATPPAGAEFHVITEHVARA